MAQIQGIIGVFFILFLAFLLSNNKSNVNYKTVVWGLGLQLFFAILILLTPIGTPIFDWFDMAVNTLLDFSVEGSKFLFSSFVNGNDTMVETPLINFAFIALPTVIFFSALMAMLYHYGVMQKVVTFISKIMQKTMGTSGAETTSISSNIFVGQTEAPLVVKPFISKMTKSELMAIMVGGFATVAGGVMALYVAMLGNIEGIAGHLLAASIMSAPAALVIAKIIYPETEKALSTEDIKMSIEKQDDNGLEALARGSSDGLKLAANIAAMLVAFVAFISLVNYLLGLIPIGGEKLSIQMILGYLFMPLAWMMGAPWEESFQLGTLLGEKLVLTEMIAYIHLSEMGSEISQRTAILASYALCGFANFASIGIQLGGIGSIAPERRKDLSKLVFKAMLGGALASWLTASIAGMMISIPEVETPKAFKDYSSNYITYDTSGKEISSDNSSTISFIYKHSKSNKDTLFTSTSLTLFDKNNKKLELKGDCAYNSMFKTFEPCIFSKHKVLYDDTSYSIELHYDSVIEAWNIVNFDKNSNSFIPRTKYIGTDTYDETNRKKDIKIKKDEN
tara:strand:+ start:271 stop:1959 length:1689 start_codon:yes stop_codon:yes gene_type:complete